MKDLKQEIKDEIERPEVSSVVEDTEVKKEEHETAAAEPTSSKKEDSTLEKSEKCDQKVNEGDETDKNGENKKLDPKHDKKKVTVLVNAGQGFNPFDPAKKDEINYDWANDMFNDYVTGLVENSNKFVIFFMLLEEAVKVGERMLMFSQSLLTLNLIEEYLQKREIPGTSDRWCNGLNYFRLDGSTSSLERDRLINAFNKAEAIKVPLFLVSTKAGSLGVNLVGANRVVIFDASWNPCHDSQAVCRVYRYGQDRPCYIYRSVKVEKQESL